MKLLGMINFLLLFSCAQAARWSPDTYPNPLKDVKSCGRRGVTSWVCDPDGIIAYDSANVVEGILKKIYNGEPPYALGPCGSYGMQGYQVRPFKALNLRVIAVVGKQLVRAACRGCFCCLSRCLRAILCRLQWL